MSNAVEVEVLNVEGLELPQYETENSAGMDARAFITEPVTIPPFKRALIPTGLKVAIPQGYTIDVDSRSGLALKNGVFVLNAPGIVDPDYRGGIGVIVANLSDEPFTVTPSMRICQLVLREYRRISWKKVDVLSDTKRAEGGFGSTGIS